MGIICTTTKTSDSTTEYTANGDCDGDNPTNEIIRGSIYTPDSLDSEDFQQQAIDVGDEDDDDDFQELSFFSNGNVEIVDSSGTRIGTYDDAELTNVVRIDFDDVATTEYRLFIMLDGSLANGTIMELRYADSVTNTLDEVFIYEIESTGQWEINSHYDNITEDN